MTKLNNKIKRSLIENLENTQFINLKSYYFNKRYDNFISLIFKELNTLLFELKNKKEIKIKYINDCNSEYLLNNIYSSYFSIYIKKCKNKKNSYVLSFEIKKDIPDNHKNTLINIEKLLNSSYEYINFDLELYNYNIFQKIYYKFEEIDSSVVLSYFVLVIICLLLTRFLREIFSVYKK